MSQKAPKMERAYVHIFYGNKEKMKKLICQVSGGPGRGGRAEGKRRNGTGTQVRAEKSLYIPYCLWFRPHLTVSSRLL